MTVPVEYGRICKIFDEQEGECMANWKDLGGYQGLCGDGPACSLCNTCENYFDNSGNSQFPHKCRGAGDAAKAACKGKSPQDCDRYKGPEKKAKRGKRQKGFCAALCSCCRCLGKCLSAFGLNAFDDC